MSFQKMERPLLTRIFLCIFVITKVQCRNTPQEDLQINVSDCPLLRFKGVVVPLDNSPQTVSVRPEKIPQVYMKFASTDDWIEAEEAGTWINFTTSRREGECCVDVPGYMDEMCRPDDPDLFLKIDPKSEALWKFDCNIVSGCLQLRLLEVSFGLKDLPSRFFWRPEDRVLKLQINYQRFEVPKSPQWHDFRIDAGSEGNIWVTSSSLGIKHLAKYHEEVWISGNDYEDYPVPSHFRQDCKGSINGGQLTIDETSQGSQGKVGLVALFVLIPFAIVISLL